MVAVDGTLRVMKVAAGIENVAGKPMMFMESGWPNIVQALDLSDPDHPQQVWHYTKTAPR